MASFLDMTNSHGKTSKSNSAVMSNLCLVVGVAACFWLVSHRQKIDCQGLSKDVHLPSLYQQPSSLQQEALQLPALQRAALRKCAGGWDRIDTQDQSWHLFGIYTQPCSHHVLFSSHGNQGLHLVRVQYGAPVALRVVQKKEHEIFQDVFSTPGQDYIFSFLFLAAS